MKRAGRAVATAVLRDFAEIGGFPSTGRILVLVGKGHNGGDALIAAQAISERVPGARIEVHFVFGERALRPLAARAWRELAQAAPDRVTIVRSLAAAPPAIDLCLDGVFGFQFRAPADDRVTALFTRVNALPIRLRAAVDLPSAGLCRADFTYATGSVKFPALDSASAGRVRYLDLGFFASDSPGAARLLTRAVLAPLATLRPAVCDKRTFGHVCVLGGSRDYPGAVLMTVLAALRSGAGLVTAFVPESLAPAYAARAPEAMWVGWPETPAGGLALEGEYLLRAKLERATALILGPGLGREPETLALARNIASTSPVPLVLDADALQPEIVAAGPAPRILTPHAGELTRIEGAKLAAPTTIVAKGPVTKIWSRQAGELPALEPAARTRNPGPAPTSTAECYHSCFGGPVLARGGSGDLLAGLIGGLLAQSPQDALLAAARGVVWHGLAAEALARAHGQTAVSVTQLLDFLPAALRESVDEQ